MARFRFARLPEDADVLERAHTCASELLTATSHEPEHALLGRRAAAGRGEPGRRVRVVAGTHGGRRLAAPPGLDTRPTSDRVREALFSILGPLDGERVLDLFAGSGALGIEALSRGAGSALFVRRRTAPPSTPPGQPGGPRAWTRRWYATTPGGYCATHTPVAPPTIWSSSTLHTVKRSDWAADSPRWSPSSSHLAARVIGESDRRAPLELELPLVDERRYGDTLIRIHTHEP